MYLPIAAVTRPAAGSEAPAHPGGPSGL